MADTQQRTKEHGGVMELVILVGILLAVAAGAVGTYWVRTHGVEAAPGTSAVTGKQAGEPTRPRAVMPAPPAGVFHADVYFDFKSTRLRADAAWVVLVQGYADRQGPAEYNRVLAQRRAEAVKQFLIDLGVPQTAIKLVTMGQEGALCDEPGKECQELNRRVHLEFRKLAAAAPAPPTVAEPNAGGRAQADLTSAAGER